MKPNCIFFDLDGTLTDSGPGILASVAYALRKLGVEPPEPEKLRPFIGPPLLWSFAHFYGFDEEKSREGMRLYREYFTAGGRLPPGRRHLQAGAVLPADHRPFRPGRIF